MKRSIAFVAFLFVALSLQAQIHPIYQGLFNHTLDSVCKKYQIKGASVAILIPGGGIWEGTYGESHAGVPISSDMYLPIGSNTKTFTACLILKLQEQGVLSLDDTIGTWLQSIPNVSGQITIRQMLNHTSGLANYTDHNDFFVALNNDYTHIFQPEDMLQYIDTPEFLPGTKWEYSNTGYLLAGLIIKKILNEPFHETVRKMILTPMGLNSTVTFPAEAPPIPEPHGWYGNSSGVATDQQVTYGWTNKAFLSMASSAGAIMSTAEDNVRFWDALMTGKIINSGSFAEMKQFASMSLGPYYGYGLGIAKATMNGRLVFAHRGTCFGYLNENLVDSATGVCITILTNDERPGNDWLYTNLLKPLHKIVIDMPPASVNELSANNNILVYPNPASNLLNIRAENLHQSAELKLHDMAGKTVITSQIQKGSNTLSLETLPAGLYMVHISNAEGLVYTQKLQINK